MLPPFRFQWRRHVSQILAAATCGQWHDLAAGSRQDEQPRPRDNNSAASSFGRATKAALLRLSELWRDDDGAACGFKLARWHGEARVLLCLSARHDTIKA